MPDLKIAFAFFTRILQGYGTRNRLTVFARWVGGIVWGQCGDDRHLQCVWPESATSHSGRPSRRSLCARSVRHKGGRRFPMESGSAPAGALVRRGSFETLIASSSACCEDSRRNDPAHRTRGNPIDSRAGLVATGGTFMPLRGGFRLSWQLRAMGPTRRRRRTANAPQRVTARATRCRPPGGGQPGASLPLRPPGQASHSEPPRGNAHRDWTCGHDNTLSLVSGALAHDRGLYSHPLRTRRHHRARIGRGPIPGEFQRPAVNLGERTAGRFPKKAI